MVLARCCGLSSVALVVAKLVGQPDNTVRQRLREWDQEAAAQRGPDRTAIDPTRCFAPRLDCTLLACREPGHEQPWRILTDLPPQAGNPAWYTFRTWIEQGFQVIKSAGWQWQRTRMEDPTRGARLWVAVAVATLWLVQVGGAAEAALAVPPAGRAFQRLAAPGLRTPSSHGGRARVGESGAMTADVAILPPRGGRFLTLPTAPLP